MADLEDDVGRRLLAETALAESEKYEVLPCDEADRLKRYTLRKASLVDDARTNLAIQTTYRDALTSVAKLPSRDAENDARAMEEKARVVGRCEDLTMGLLDLQTCLAEDLRRLLEHTAGVLRSDVQQHEALDSLPKTPDHLCSCSHGQQKPCERCECDYADQSPVGQSIRPPSAPEQRKRPSTRRDSDSINEKDDSVLKSVNDSERKLSSVNVSLHGVLSRLSHGFAAEDLSPPPRLDPSDYEPCERLETQIEYLEKVLAAVRKESDETEKSVRELFCVVQEAFAVVKQKRDQRKMARADKGLPVDDGEQSDGGFEDDEAYSIGAFSDRVRYLSSRFVLRSGQLTVLEQQIKQQRELNNRAAIERNEELAQRAKLVAEAVKGQAALTEELKVAEVRVRALQERVEAEAARARNAESQLQIAKAGRAAAEAAAETLRAELENRALETTSHQEKIRENDEELEQLKITLAKAKTDAAIARAELEGAYGRRCAPDPAVAAVKRSEEYVAVQSQVDKLKRELTEAKLQCTDVGGGVKYGAGVTALSEQFRTTLSEERRKFRHALSAERATRRKLEELVQQLNAKQGPEGSQ